MNYAALALSLLTCVYIVTLPLTFFKSGVYNIKWLLTGAPFIGMAASHVFAAIADWQPQLPVSWWDTTTIVSVLLNAASIAIIAMTVGTHRIPLALWHQEDDAPRSIVTYGPYARVRHPFYTAFIVYSFAGVLLFPHVITLVWLVYVLVALNLTAAREERRLSASEFGAEYIAYKDTVGRFTPKLRAQKVDASTTNR